MLKNYFYNLLSHYISLYALGEDTVVTVDPVNDKIIKKKSNIIIANSKEEENSPYNNKVVPLSEINKFNPDYILMNGTVHYERDVQRLLEDVHQQCRPHTRLIITFYSYLWLPFFRLMSKLGVRDVMIESNWVSPVDITNLLELSNFELVRTESRVLLPLYIPFISNIVNRYIAPLPIFSFFNMLNIVVARPLSKDEKTENDRKPSVSIIVPAKNEEGNIDGLLKRLPQMGPDDELIIVEGNSTDNTWEKIKEVYKKWQGRINIQIAQQDGIGKGDAVRKGFNMATKDILMILDADLTVPPEVLPKFYSAIRSGKGEFINGSRLVYPMEKNAMRFANIVGNKFFAIAFSFVLGQRFKDTLCGTKVISRNNYLRLAEHRYYFGNFDPFGDFDLIFGASRMCLKIVEIPIAYKERLYGYTNISRWRHGTILLRMLIFAARKIKFI